MYALFVKTNSQAFEGWRYEGMVADLVAVEKFKATVKTDVTNTAHTAYKTLGCKVVDLNAQ